MIRKPVILALDDEPGVLRAVERDLRSEYRDRYRVVRADSGAAALELLDELGRRGEVPALFVVDQRMPQMSGVEFFERAAELYPDARRVLLTAYADTDAAIAAINTARVDHYLLKPWDPPEEKLFPVLNDLLEDWQAVNDAPFDGIRVIGHQWSPDSHRIKDFLARNHVPYAWLDIATNEEASTLLQSSDLPQSNLPLLLFTDGTHMSVPSNREIADRIGIRTIAEQPIYDLLVVGGGPAGLAAAVYGASEGLRTLVVEVEAPGGQAGMSSRIENYLGFPSGVSGGELARRAVTQAKRFGVEILTTRRATKLEVDGPTRVVTLEDGTELNARALVIATGVSYRQLQAKGCERLTGAGIYYGAALSEGEFVRGKNAYIVGGANSAGQAAMYFSRYAEQVTMLVRGDSLTASMSQYLIDQIDATPNIRVETSCQVKEAIGTERLEQLVIERAGAKEETVDAQALFIFIGAVPRTDWLGDVVSRDERGFILSGLDAMAATPVSSDKPRISRSRGSKPLRIPSTLETSVPGIFVAGDVRAGSVKRVASAVGEGSMAVMYVHKYLQET